MASATICPPSSQPSLPSSCVPASPAAKGVGTAPQIAPRITALPLASRVSGMYPLESCARVARYDHHQLRGRERTSSCTCQRSGFQYLPTQFSTTLPIAGSGLRPAGRPSSTRSGIKQARAMRPAQAGSTHTVQRPAVVPTNPRARAARSPAAGQGRCCTSHAVLMAPRSTALIISAPSLSHVVGTRPMRHDTSRVPTNQSRVHARRQPPHTRVVVRLRDTNE